jgi:tRNA threonylcarbamoyl adenosine modification protein YeaZ
VKVLVLESSTARLSLAWFENEACVATECLEMERGRDAQLFPVLRRLMDAAGVQDGGADGILVGLGPGSYTGVRIAIAAAQGLALGWKAQIAGTCSLLGIEHSERLDECFVVGDARRGAAWVVRIAGGMLAGDFFVQPSTEVREMVSELQAKGESVLTPDPVPLFPGVTTVQLAAASLGRTFFQQKVWAWEAGDTPRLEPLYLAPPYITKAKRRLPSVDLDASDESGPGNVS